MASRVPALVLLAAVAGFAAAVEGAPRARPVVVVEDRAEIERGLREHGVPFDATFVATPEEAQRPRRDLNRFIRADLKRAERPRAQRLRRMLRAAPTQLWHCAGFERGGKRHLYCAVTRPEGEQANVARFPTATGADTARCIFSIEAGQIVTLSWHGEG